MASAALAQTSTEALKQLTLEQLSQVEVTSVNKEAESAFKTPAAITVLTSEQIRRSGARQIPELLRLVPGVNVGEIDSSEWATGVRGFQGNLSRAMLVLIDGRSVYTPLFAGVYWDMQGVMVDDIDRIEVIRGPGGTIWGSNAVNGVVNIITKDSRDTHGGLVRAGGGTLDQGELDVRYGGGTDALSYRAYARGFTRGPEHHQDNRNFDDWRKGQAGFRMDAQLGDRDTLTVQGDAYSGEAGQRLQLSTYSPPANPAVDGEKRFNGANLMAAWRRNLTSGGNVQFRGYWDRTERQELNYKEVRNTIDFDFVQHKPISRHELTWGAGARISPSLFTQKTPGVIFTPPSQNYNIFSFFLEDEVSIIPGQFKLTLGSKFEHTTYSGFNSQPSVRASWTPTERQILWGSVTRAVRTASRIEDGFLFSSLAQPNLPLYVRLVGDGGFRAEHSVSTELGYRNYVIRHGFIDLSLFHGRYQHLLSVEPQPVQVETTPAPTHLILPLYLRNGIAAQSNGGEISAVFDVTGWWRLGGWYATVFLDARRTSGSSDASTVRQLEGDTARHTAAIQSSFSLPRGIDVRLTYRYVSAIPDQRVTSYHTGDVRLGWRFHPNYEFEVMGQNLLQPWHIEYGGVPGPLIGVRRRAYAGIRWRY